MLEYRDDTQLLIEGTDLDADAIHDHINAPWKVLEYCATLGEILDVAVVDMDRQSRG